MSHNGKRETVVQGRHAASETYIDIFAFVFGKHSLINWLAKKKRLAVICTHSASIHPIHALNALPARRETWRVHEMTVKPVACIFGSSSNVFTNTFFFLFFLKLFNLSSFSKVLLLSNPDFFDIGLGVGMPTLLEILLYIVNE